MRFVAACTAVLLLTSSSAALATPTTPEIQAKQAQAAQAQAKLDSMREDQEVLAEEYNRIDDALHKTRGRIEQARARLEIEDSNLQRAQQLLDDRADAIYRRSDVDVLAVVLNTTSFEDFLTRLDLLMRIGTSDARVVTSVKDARQQVQETKRTLEQREAEQVALRDQADAKRQQVESAAARQKQFLDSLNGEIAQLIKKEEERLAAEAAARAARLRAEEEARRQAAARLASANGGSDGAAGRIADLKPGDGRPEVVAVAMRYIGVPYVWGGTTPDGFDCSGLVQYAYKQIGIDIPRTSQEQYYAGKHISPDGGVSALKPGDLLFFGRGKSPDAVHHVVMYAGGDDIIEAPYTGANVRVASLAVRLSHNEYVGASRF